MAYPSFLARPVAPVRGLATRGPAAAARATGGRVPVITTDQGVTTPAPQGPSGLASLTRNMQQEIEDTESPDELNWKMAQAGEELGKLFRGEDDLSGGGDVLSGSEGTEVLVGGETKTMDDGRVLKLGSFFQSQDSSALPADSLEMAADQLIEVPTEETDPLLAEYEKSLADAMGKEALTTEAANKQAKKILGIKEKEDVPDWAMPLFTFGMALMAEPGSFGQAVGKAGLKTVPVIAQVKKEKKAERRQVGKIAYNLMTADAATRSKAVDRSMNYLWKQKTFNQAERKFKFDQKQALFDGIYKWIGSLPDRAKAVASGQMAELLSGQFLKGTDLSDASLNDMENAAGAFIAKTTSDMHKTNPLAWAEMQGWNVIGEGDWATQKLMGNDGREATYRVNKVAGKYPVYGTDGQPVFNDDGTPKLKFYNAFELRQKLDQGRVVSGGPADPGWQLALFGGPGDKMYQKLINTNDYITPREYIDADGKVYPAGSIVPAGLFLKDTGDKGRKRSQVGSLYTLNKHGQPIAITGSPEDIKKGLQAARTMQQLEEFENQKYEVLQSARLAKSIINLIDTNPRATAITGGLTGKAIKLAQKIDVWLGGWTGKDFKAFERGLGSLGIFKNVDVSAGGTVAGNASSLFGISKKMDLKYVNSIKNTKFGSAKKGSVERKLTDDEFNALQGLAALNIGMRARLWKMAYAVARVSEPGGRLTDRDFANALVQMGVDEDGNFDPASLKATLSDLAASAQQGVADRGNTMYPKARMTVETIYGPKGSYPNAPIFKGGNLEKLITPKAGQPSGGQPRDNTWLLKTFPLLVGKTGMVKGVETPIFSSEGRVNSEALADRRRLVQQVLGGGQTISADQRAALTAEIQRLNALTNIVLERRF